MDGAAQVSLESAHTYAALLHTTLQALDRYQIETTSEHMGTLVDAAVGLLEELTRELGEARKREEEAA